MKTRLIVLLAFFGFFTESSAQTTIISSTATTSPNGSFENGTSTFAANGWTAVNGATNQWFVGTQVSNAGSKGAYIGTGSNNNNYTVTTAQVSHFYRDVTFPAGETCITLSFNWKGVGESCCDFLKVYMTATSTSVTANTQLSAADQIGGTYNNQTAWQTATITVPASYAGTTKRLVFSWRNDGSVGTTPAIAVDNISLVSSGSGGTAYAAIPYAQDFESWTSTCGSSSELPSVNWQNTPTSGNNSWRRDDQGVSTGGWSNTSGAYSPLFTTTAHSARFHSYSASSGTQGFLDLYVDLSGITGNKTISFDHINTSGSDVLNVKLSTNGGSTFPTSITGDLGVSSTWTSRSYCITSNSATAVIRFEATSDFGATDIGIDNLVISGPCSGAPTAGTASASATSVCTGSTSILSLTGNTNTCGITYQWESSVNNSTWTNITGATSSTYTATVTSTLYYRCVVTCSGNSSNSSSVLITCTSQSNDNCAGAIALTPGATCTYTNADVSCATQSLAGCSGTANDDVWFSFVAANTSQIITVNSSASFDPVVQVYSGSCGGTSILCNDANFTTGTVGSVMVSGLTVGSTYWIRVYHYSSSVASTTTFGICVTDPPTCPSGLGTTVSVASLPYSSTGRTTCGKGNEITQTNAVICGSNNYYRGEDEVFIFTPSTSGQITITQSNTSGTVGIMLYDGCPFSGTCVGYVQSSTSPKSLCVNVTAGVTYYLVVDSWPSPNCYSYDISITAPTTTSVTCNLNYSVATTTYSATNSMYTGGTTVTLTDDYFADAYSPIGFTFCFDGIAYTQCLISSNGYLIFDKIGCITNLPGYTGAAPGGYSPYSFDISIPDATESPRNAVLGPWQDINPNSGGTIKYQTTGTAPNRVFIAAFDNIPYYDCTTLDFKGLIKLFETTNEIEVHIANKEVCSTWNDGNAILGLQNFDGTIAVVPGGYNGLSSNWTVNSTTAWKFTPSCAGCTTPLPIELTAFNAKAVNSYNELRWETSSEKNNNYFAVEHSIDGVNFSEIGTVKGAGTTSESRSYSFIDKDPFNEITYYRLTQVDYDGKGNLSGIISVRRVPKRSFDFIEVYPVPASDIVNVKINTFEAGTVTTEILDATGRLLKSEESSLEAGHTVLKLNISDLRSGVYFVRVKHNGAYTQIKKLVRN